MSISFTGPATPATAPTSKATPRPSRDKKRAQIADSIKAEPQLSDREHARRTGVSPSTIAAVRKKLQAAGEVSNLDTRIDPRGYEQPAQKRKPVRPQPVSKPDWTMNQMTTIPLAEWQRARRKD